MWKNMGGFLYLQLAMTLLDHQFLHRIASPPPEIHLSHSPGWRASERCRERMTQYLQPKHVGRSATKHSQWTLDLVLFSNTTWYWSEIWHVISNQLLSHIIILIWYIRYVTHANFDFVMGCWRVRYINMPRSFWLKHLGLSQHLTTNPVLNIIIIAEIYVSNLWQKYSNSLLLLDASGTYQNPVTNKAKSWASQRVDYSKLSKPVCFT